MLARATILALAIAHAALAQAQFNPAWRDRVLSAPDCAGPANIIAEEAREPANVTHMRVQHIGNVGTEELRGEVEREITWDVGAMTGLNAASSSQRGYRDAPPPVAASAFQLECGNAGFFINSFQFDHSVPLFGEGPSAGIGRVLDPAPPAFEDGASRIIIQARIAVPTSYSPALVPDSGVTAVSFYYYVVDTKSGLAIAHVIGLLDNRPPGVGGSGQEMLANDGITPFAASPLADIDGYGRPVRFVEAPLQTAKIRYGETWTEPVLFRAEIPHARFKAMIEALHGQSPALSVEPLDYRIAFFGVLAEIAVGTERGHDVMLGGSVRDLTLARGRLTALGVSRGGRSP